MEKKKWRIDHDAIIIPIQVKPEGLAEAESDLSVGTEANIDASTISGMNDAEATISRAFDTVGLYSCIYLNGENQLSVINGLFMRKMKMQVMNRSNR